MVYYLCIVVLLLDISLKLRLVELLVALVIFLIYNVSLSLHLLLSSVLPLAAVILFNWLW